MPKESDTSSSENESKLGQLESKQVQLLDIEKRLKTHQSEIKKRIQEAQDKEIVAIQTEAAFLDHKKQITELIENLKKEKNELDIQTHDKKLLFHNVAEIWHKHFERLLHIKADFSREVQHVTKLIESDLHLLYEKERELKETADSVNKDKENIAQKKEELAKVKVLEEALQKHEEHFNREEGALAKVKISRGKQKKQEQKKIIQPLIEKPTEAPRIVALKPQLKEEKFSVEVLLSSARQAIDSNNVAKAEELLEKIKKNIKKIKDTDKKVEYEFEFKELETNLKLAKLN